MEKQRKTCDTCGHDLRYKGKTNNGTEWVYYCDPCKEQVNITINPPECREWKVPGEEKCPGCDRPDIWKSENTVKELTSKFCKNCLHYWASSSKESGIETLFDMVTPGGDLVEIKRDETIGKQYIIYINGQGQRAFPAPDENDVKARIKLFDLKELFGKFNKQLSDFFDH